MGNLVAVDVSVNAIYQAAVVAGGSIYVSSSYGSAWAASAFTAQWSSIVTSSSGRIMAASINGGGIYVSKNYSSTWIG